MGKYFKLNSVLNTADYVLSWQSKGISNESIKPLQQLITVLLQN